MIAPLMDDARPRARGLLLVDKILTARKAAKFLGVPVKQVEALCNPAVSADPIPHYLLPLDQLPILDRIQIKESELRDWFERHRRILPPASGPHSAAA